MFVETMITMVYFYVILNLFAFGRNVASQATGDGNDVKKEEYDFEIKYFNHLESSKLNHEFLYREQATLNPATGVIRGIFTSQTFHQLL